VRERKKERKKEREREREREREKRCSSGSMRRDTPRTKRHARETRKEKRHNNRTHPCMDSFNFFAIAIQFLTDIESYPVEQERRNIGFQRGEECAAGSCGAVDRYNNSTTE
jgi:hypothetical protein